MEYSIKLDVLRSIVAERLAWISEALATEESKDVPDAAVINALDDERSTLPTWGMYPDEQTIDAEIGRWRAIVKGQGNEGSEFEQG